jgi:hypothetical protein
LSDEALEEDTCFSAGKWPAAVQTARSCESDSASMLHGLAGAMDVNRNRGKRRAGFSKY